MIKDLTPRAKRILADFAMEEARRSHSDQIQNEHVILAMLNDKNSAAVKCLDRLNIGIEAVTPHLMIGIPHLKNPYKVNKISPSSRVETLLNVSANEAARLSHEYIGTEHLLLAAVLEKGSPMCSFFESKNISIDDLRRVVREVYFERNQTRKISISVEKSGFSTINISKMNKPKFEILGDYSRDLTDMARKGLLSVAIGREREINRLIRILARRKKNNPVLIGDPGVGKTAVVEGFAMEIVKGNVPDVFLEKSIISLDLAALIAGTKYRGAFESRIKKVVKEISSASNIILFIDELHTIIGAGAAEGALDASNMLKPALSRGELQCIGATTFDEYVKYIEKDSALERRFQPVIINEPTVSETCQILKGLSREYGDFHKVSYNDEALQAAADLADRYVADRNLPDKAIDLIDEAGAVKSLQNKIFPEEIKELEEKCRQLSDRKVSCVDAQDYESAARMRDKVQEMRSRIDAVKREWESSLDRVKNQVTKEDIQELVSENTGIPMIRIMKNESDKLLQIEDELHKTVIGQDEAIASVSSLIRRSRTGLNSPSRPLGSFIFLGPTGVGKSLLAKSLAEYLFGNSDSLIRIDMTDFMEKHNLSRLIGAPPGFVGYEEGGLLTEKIRKRPYSVILLDEIEKAHPDIFNILLQVLDEGELQDSFGHKVSFKNAVLIMTSNAGAREFSRGSFGFSTRDGAISHSEIKSSAMMELKRIFRPEFLNRVDETVVFHSLEYNHVIQIMDLMLTEVSGRLKDLNICVEVDRAVKEFLMDRGFDAVYGARSLWRVIQKEIEDPLSMAILQGRFESRDKVAVELLQSGKIRFRRKNRRRTKKTANETAAARS